MSFALAFGHLRPEPFVPRVEPTWSFSNFVFLTSDMSEEDISAKELIARDS